MVSATVVFPVRSIVTMASALASSSLPRSVSTNGGHCGLDGGGGGESLRGAAALAAPFFLRADFAGPVCLRADFLTFALAFGALAGLAPRFGLLLAFVAAVLAFLTALTCFLAGFFRGLVLLANHCGF
jgi:hypothetical protein